MLNGLLAIETGGGMAGPLVTRNLRDLNARVIKVESTTRMDFTKVRLPPPGKTAEDVLHAPAVEEMTADKESVTLNLKTEQGRELFMRLLDLADVYVESFAPGWLERIGLSLQEIQRRNPRLVILSQSAYGGEGPKKEQRAYAPVMTALAGVESTTGYADGRIVPQIVSAVGDIVAATLGTFFVFAALYDRQRTGFGAIIDMSQIEASAAMAGVSMAEYGLTGKVPLPQGNRHPAYAPHGIYRTAGYDDWIAIEVTEDSEWTELCAVLGITDDVRDRFATAPARLGAMGEIDSLVSERTTKEERDDLWRRLQLAGIPATPVLDIYEVDDFPAHVDRRLWTAFDHPRGELRLTEVPWKVKNLDVRCRGWGKDTGSSTESVLRDLLGASDHDLKAWRASGSLD